MARFDTYSRLVAWLKILLPLVALGILSTLFLVSRGHDGGGPIPFSEAELDTLLEDQRIRAPNFAGLTDDGSAVTLGADEARPVPDQPGRAEARGLAGRIDNPDGGWTALTAALGTIDQAQGLARLEGDVRIVNSSGFDIRTDAATARLDSTRIATDGPIDARAPGVELSAGRMILHRAPDNRYVLDFIDGVRLLYSPPTTTGGAQ